jgi:hypothetical protein
MYFLHMYEYGTLESVLVILRSGGGRRIMEMNQTGVHYMCTWNVTMKPPVQLL